MFLLRSNAGNYSEGGRVSQDYIGAEVTSEPDFSGACIELVQQLNAHRFPHREIQISKVANVDFRAISPTYQQSGYSAPDL